jgi:hypothetical protein
MFSAEPGKILYQFGGAANSPDEAIIDIWNTVAQQTTLPSHF